MKDKNKAQADFSITNELGLHFRAAAIMVRTAKEFASKVTITSGTVSADASSVLDLLTLAAAKGTEITVSAEGEDAHEAVEAMGRLIRRNFAE